MNLKVKTKNIYDFEISNPILRSKLNKPVENTDVLNDIIKFASNIITSYYKPYSITSHNLEKAAKQIWNV